MKQTMTLLDGCPNLAKCQNIPLLTYMINYEISIRM